MVDLRNRQPPIKSQGPRGTCVAFAATAAHEWLWADGLDLSEEYLFWAAKQRDGTPQANATTLTAAAEALSALGQPEENIWPYDPSRDHLAITYQPPDGADAAARSHRATGGGHVAPTAETLRAALRAGQLPVLVVELYDPWFLVGPDGRIAMPTQGATQRGGHAVLVVGYDDGTDDFIVRNSWGPGWAAAGYGYLPYPYVAAHARDAWLLAE